MAGTNFVLGRMRIVLQQCLRPHHHAGDAVAALRRLFLDEGVLHRVHAEPLDRADVAAGQRGERHQAGEHRLAIHHHRAGAALPQPAAEFGAIQPEFVA